MVRPPSIATVALTAQHRPASTFFAAVNLRYLARAAIVVRGPATGMEYCFSAAQPLQRVARADREALLRTGHFVES